MDKLVKIIAEPTEDRPHARLSPSASARWIACPGSVAPNAAAPYRQSDAADEGTAAHALLEMSLRGGVSPYRFVGMRFMPKFPVTESMAQAVSQAVDWIEDYIEDAEGEVDVYIEHFITIGPAIGIEAELLSGTSDVVLIDRAARACVVFDYKHGMKIVEAKNNPQLLLYALGLSHEEGPFSSYRCVIAQPRAAKARPIDSHVYTHKQLREWAEGTVHPAARIALDKWDDAPRAAGDHCRWCAAASSCRTYMKHIGREAASEFREFDLIRRQIPGFMIED